MPGVRAARRLKAIDAIDVLSDLFILRGVSAHIRSDNAREHIARSVQDWIGIVDARTAYIAPGSPWENGFIESFDARLHDELLNGEVRLHPAGGRDRHRELAPSLQRRPAACLARLPRAGA